MHAKARGRTWPHSANRSTSTASRRNGFRCDALPSQIGADCEPISAGMVARIENQLGRFNSAGVQLLMQANRRRTPRARGPEMRDMWYRPQNDSH